MTSKKRDITRRDLLKTAGAAGAAAFMPVAAPPDDPARAAHSGPEHGGASTPTAGPRAELDRARGPMMNLTAAEAELLSAMIDRLIPTDELGPGAIESGVLYFIDRALGEADSGAVDAYRAGLAALDRYSEYSRGSPFLDLSERDRDSVLIDLQTGGATGAGVGFLGSSGSFFNLVKSHTWQGMFGDPQYGGNIGFAGWDLLGYPGVRMRVSADEQRRLEAEELPDVRQSAYEYETFRMEDDE